MQWEVQVRAHRSDSDWWRSQWQATDTDLDRRTWLFSILTAAHLAVVLELAAEIDAATAALSPRHYRAMESCPDRAGLSDARSER